MHRTFGLMALLTLAWGLNWPMTKLGVTALPPLWFRSLGLVLGTALLGAILVMRGTSLKIAPAALPRIALLSLPNITVWYTLVTIALTRLPAGRAAILGFTMPVWSALIGALVYRESIDARVASAVICAIAGIGLLVAGDVGGLAAHPTGVLLMLGAAMSWAWGTHLFRRADLGIDTLSLTFWMMVCACPVIVGLSAIFEAGRWRLPVGVEWLPILYSAVLVLALGNLIWFVVARSLPPTIAGLSSMLVPVVGVFSSALILGEIPGPRDFAALALTASAVLLALRRPAVDRS